MEVEIDEWENDFQTPLPIVTQLNNKRKKLSETEDNEVSCMMEVSTCPLCQKNWTIAGLQRIVSLSCGHLFCRSCIQQKVRFSGKPKKGKCPICSESFGKNDIWPIWPKKIIKPDPFHIKEMQQELEDYKKKELEQKDAIELVQTEIKLCRNELSQLNSSQPLISTPQPLPSSPLLTVNTPQSTSSCFIDWETIQLSSEANVSRVMTFVPSREEIVVSMIQNGKHGLKKIKIEAPTLSEFIGNHDKLVRDLKYSTQQNMLLSTGFDKTLSLTSINSNTVAQLYKLDSQGWSCSFDSKNPNLLYSGLMNGSLLVFDIRNTGNHLHNLKANQTNNSPIHSISVGNFIESDPSITSVICSSLTQCYTWIFNDASNEPELLNLYQDIAEYKPFSIYSESNTMLASFRTSSSTKYIMSSFSNTDPKQTEIKWSFDSNHPQPLMSRNIFFQREREIIFCLTNQNKMDIRSKSGIMQQLEMNGGVLDVKHHSIHNVELLAGLSGNELKIFKYDECILEN